MSQLKEINGKYYKNCKVVMFPTTEKISKGSILLTNSNRLFISENGNPFDILGGYNKLQHLYITSDKEIKEGDYYVNIFQNKYDIRFCKSKYLAEFLKGSLWTYKIIATTDTSLFIPYFENGKEEMPIFLPQLSQQFIEKYIEEYNKGNIITDILVEYDKADYNKWMDNGASPVFDTIKINPKKNTINIKEVKELWNREDIYKALLDKSCLEDKKSMDEWIKENL